LGTADHLGPVRSHPTGNAVAGPSAISVVTDQRDRAGAYSSRRGAAGAPPTSQRGSPLRGRHDQDPPVFRLGCLDGVPVSRRSLAGPAWSDSTSACREGRALTGKTWIQLPGVRGCKSRPGSARCIRGSPTLTGVRAGPRSADARGRVRRPTRCSGCLAWRDRAWHVSPAVRRCRLARLAQKTRPGCPSFLSTIRSLLALSGRSLKKAVARAPGPPCGFCDPPTNRVPRRAHAC